MTDRTRLSEKTFARLPQDIARPAYDRARVRGGIVHLGVGAFFKAHQAVYTDDALAEAGGDWAIEGVSLRRPEARDALAPQDGLYIVGARDGKGEARRLIGALKSVLVAPEDPEAVIALLAAPDVKVVTLTITEKGYNLSPRDGRLDLSASDIASDLAEPTRPSSALGYMVAGLARRRALKLPPPTFLSCDNLSHNGEKLRRAVVDFAEEIDAGLARWIETEAVFPSSMVDRIVPATTGEDRKALADSVGLYDAAYVKTEPFRQWVIEDRFAQGRPRWEAGGALFVSDVAPYETMKLRLLNGTHSAMAYLGYLAGREHISDVMADPAFARFVDALMEEDLLPAVPPVPGVDLSGYIAELKARFSNPALKHRTWQIAMDGSQKLPQRLTDIVRAHLRQGRPLGRLALIFAAWMRYVGGIDEKGAPIDVRDPLADLLKQKGRTEGPARARTEALLGVRDIFGDDLPKAEPFVAAVAAALDALEKNGAAAAVRG